MAKVKLKSNQKCTKGNEKIFIQPSDEALQMLIFFSMKQILWSLLFLLSVGYIQAQSSISGRVLNASDEPLQGASVRILDTQLGTATDLDGKFRIQGLSEGTYQIEVSYIGYEEQIFQQLVQAKENQELTFQLSEKPISFGAITVKATRAGADAPITYTNLDKEAIERNNLGQDVPYLLRWTPSAVVTSDAGTGIGYTGIRIRGTDPSRINVTVNGVPLNDSESQGVFWVDLPDFASSTDNIQIQRGVGTSTNGAGAFGATISLNTNVFKEDPYAQINTSIGSFNTKKANLSFGSGLINKHFTFDGRVSRIESDGFIDRASVDLSSYYFSTAYMGRKSSLRFNVFSGQEVTYQAWNGVPAQFIDDPTLRTFNTAGTDRPGEPHDNEVDDYRQNYYQLFYNNQLTSNWDLNLTANYTLGQGFFELYKGDASFDRYQLTPVQVGDETITSSDLIERRWLDNDFYFGSAALNYGSDNQDLNLSLGSAFSQYNGDHFGEVIWARFASDSELNHRYYDNEGIKKDFNIFGKATYAITPKLSGFLDLQYRRVDYEFEGFNNEGSSVQQNVDFNFFNPKIGLSFFPTKNTTVYAYFGVANKEPNRSDFTDSSPNSRPTHETLYDTEIGIKNKWDRAALEANFYYMAYDNQLVLTGQINDVGEYARINVPNSYRLGIELVGGIQLTKNFDANGSLTLSDNKISSFTEFIDSWDTGTQETIEHEDTDLSFSPRAILNTDLRYEFLPNSTGQNFNISLLSKYVGKQFIDNTSNENTALDSYFFTDGRIEYAFKTKLVKEVALTFLVRNMFDAKFSTNAWTYRYISEGYDGRPDDPSTRLEQGSTYNLTGFYPQAGRNFLLGLKLKF